MELTFEVDNIKCRGCARSIERALKEIASVSAVGVDLEAGRVTISAAADVRRAVCDALLQLGYPERGTASGLSAASAKAKSFVSCAIGRFGD